MDEIIWITPSEDPIANHPGEDLMQEFMSGDIFAKNSLLADWFYRRGISDNYSAQAYLNPALYQPSAGSEFPDMEKAVNRIVLAIRGGETICIWGDFDVDGQTSTSVLVQGLRKLGGNVIFYIPSREKESHGVFIPSLKRQIDNGTSLLITCDTGIAAVEAVEFSNQAGIHTIITDHHELPETLPPAYAILNPHLLPENHPLSALPGVGVAFKLIEALFLHFGRETETDQFLDLTAIGIIADVAALVKDTRYLAQRGINMLRQTQRIGLQIMFEMAEINPSGINEDIIGFAIGPRLNALGRLGDANRAVEFLTSDNKNVVRVIAIELEGLNAQRQILTEDVFQNALLQLQQNPNLLKFSALVLVGKSWPPGIIGIVASRLVTKFHKPVILFSCPDNLLARGSARSFGEVNIIQAISGLNEMLLSFGGHSMAAGLAISAEKINEFREKISSAITRQLGPQQLQRKLVIDSFVNLSDLTMDLADLIEKMAPFGAGNPKITLAVQNIKIAKKQIIGKRKDHLMLQVADQNGFLQKVLYWQGADSDLPEGLFDLAYTIRKTTFQGQPELQSEWIAWNQSQENKNEIFNGAQIIWGDFREDPFPTARLLSLQKEYPELQIWGEAVETNQLPLKKRFELTSTKSLAVFTLPPDRTTLIDVLTRIKPDNVFVFSIDPGVDQPEKFLKRLLGIMKFLTNKNQSSVSVNHLAAACALTDSIIRLGLNYLQNQNVIEFQNITEDKISFRLINPKITLSLENPSGSSLIALKEIAAFRVYFRKANLSKLFHSGRAS